MNAESPRKVLELPERGEERVLGRVRRLVRVAEDPEAEVVDARAVTLDENLEGVGAPFLETPDEQLVAVGGIHGRDATRRAARRSR